MKKDKKHALSSPWVYLASIILAATCISEVSFFWQNPSLLLLLLAANGILMISIGKPKEDAALFCIMGAWGALAEITGIKYGVWMYRLPDFYGIPLWLPLVWGNAAVFIKRSWEFIQEYAVK
ncbi:MAG: DUF2878 family protein [Candidatus Micrarchaeota archaeon]|nr:DUF2878 family protein [Candidatus Micrarchaeota archaeon]